MQICLHSVLCWGRLITRDGVEREELGQSFALLCLACEQARFMKSGKLILFLTTSGISPVLFLLLPHTHIYLNVCMWRRTGRRKWCPFSYYFFTTPPLLSTLTGIVVSECSMAGLIKGASTVSTPSGERAEVTFSTSAEGGRLRGRNTTQLGQKSEEKKTIKPCFSVRKGSVLQFSQKLTGPKRLVKRVKFSCSLVCVTLWPLDGSRAL